MDKKFQPRLEIDDHILHLTVSDISEITRLSACTAKKERKRRVECLSVYYLDTQQHAWRSRRAAEGEERRDIHRSMI